MWSQDSDVIIKEEQDAVSSDQDSPRAFDHPLQGSNYHDLNYGVTVTLTPSEGYDYLEPGDSPHLETLQPLPSFHCLPTSPSRKQLDYIPVSLSEFINNTAAGGDSPDSSSCQPLPQPGLTTGGAGRRKRTTSGSSGSSGTSSTSRHVKRRRPPISQEELMVQRNQANVRERQRTKNLNDAFSTLREIVPTLPSDKLSKIQTLRLASRYIDFLKQVLDDGGQQEYTSGGGGGGRHTTSFSARAGQQPDYEPRGHTGFSVREELSHSFNVWRMDMDYRSPDSTSPVHSQ